MTITVFPMPTVSNASPTVPESLYSVIDQRLWDDSTSLLGELIVARGSSYHLPSTDASARWMSRYQGLRRLALRLWGFANLKHGWDGADSSPPELRDIGNAVEFMGLLPPRSSLPLAYVEADGEVGFFWRNTGTYGEVAFRSGLISYYVRARDGHELEGERPFNSAIRDLGALSAILARM